MSNYLSQLSQQTGLPDTQELSAQGQLFASGISPGREHLSKISSDALSNTSEHLSETTEIGRSLPTRPDEASEQSFETQGPRQYANNQNRENTTQPTIQVLQPTSWQNDSFEIQLVQPVSKTQSGRVGSEFSVRRELLEQSETTKSKVIDSSLSPLPSADSTCFKKTTRISAPDSQPSSLNLPIAQPSSIEPSNPSLSSYFQTLASVRNWVAQSVLEATSENIHKNVHRKEVIRGNNIGEDPANEAQSTASPPTSAVSSHAIVPPAVDRNNAVEPFPMQSVRSQPLSTAAFEDNSFSLLSKPTGPSHQTIAPVISIGSIQVTVEAPAQPSTRPDVKRPLTTSPRLSRHYLRL